MALHPPNSERDLETIHPDDEIVAMIDLSSNTITVGHNGLDHADGKILIGFAGDKPTNLSGVKWGYDLSRVLDNARTKFAYIKGQDYRGYISSSEDYITVDNYEISFRTLYRLDVWCYNGDVKFNKIFEFKSYDYQNDHPEGYPDATLPEGHERWGRTTSPHNFWD